MKSARLKSKLLAGLGIGLTAGLILPPLAWLVVAMAATPFSARGIGLDPRGWTLLYRSLLLALLSTGLAVGIGWPYGWLVARYNLRGRRALMLGTLGPLLLPPYGAAHAWFQLFTRDSALNQLLLRWGWVRAPILSMDAPWLSALVLAFAYWPIVAWFVVFAARSVPRELEDSARLHTDDATAARWSAGPALWRALPAAGLLVYLLALADFGVPNSLGLKTYPVLVVDRFQTTRYPGDVARLALPLVCLVIPLVLVQLRLLKGTPLAPRGDFPTRLLRGPIWAALGPALCLFWLGLSWMTPMAILLRESMPLSTYAAVWAESQDHFINTLLAAGGGALLGLALALLYGWTTRSQPSRGLDLLLTLPYALPASLIGVAFIQLFNRKDVPEWLYGSLLSLVWAYVVLFFPFVAKCMQPAWGSVDQSLLDDGAVLGAGGWTQFCAAAWPTLRPHAAAGAVIAGLLAAREIDATALIRVPGGDTVSFRIQDYLHFAPGPNVAALCILLVLLSAAVVAAAAAWIVRGE